MRFSQFKKQIIEALPPPPVIEEPEEIEVPIEEKVDANTDLTTTNKFIMPSDLSRPVFVMCPPFSLDTGDPNNVWMQKLSEKERKVNKLKAVEQFFSLYAFISNLALVYLLPSKKGLGDLPYVANMGIKLPNVNDNTVIISNFKSEPREGETAVGVDFFQNLGYNTVVAPPCFEGEADLKYLHKNIFIGGYGSRTTLDCLKWFEKTYDLNIIPLEMTDPKLYHLDCVVFPLEDDKVWVATEAVAPKTIRQIEKVAEIVPIPKRVMYHDATNCVRINGLVLNNTNINTYPKGTDDYEDEANKISFLEKICAQASYEPVFFDLSEFAKSGAALSCMIMHLNYPDYNTGGEH